MTVTQRVITLITVAAGVALSTAGVPALATTAGTQVVGSPVYDTAWAGYQAGGGRWFRFVSTTVTVNLNASTVTPVNVATNTALAPIPVGSYPGAAAVAPNSKIAYVTTPFALTPINVATNTALTPIPIDAGAYAIAIAP
jgi:DNA-binding beta-propeller fold protein YncE